MRDWLDSIPNLGVPGVPGVQPQKSASFREHLPNVPGVPGVPEHLTGTPGTPAGTPKRALKPLRSNEEHREHLEHRQKNEGQVRALLRAWQDGLNSLDPDKPRHGLTAGRWCELVGDVDWLAENFAARAARDGWMAGELFGLWPGKDGWGGLADRLRGSRSLVMTADRARWRMMHCETADQLNRGAYPNLRPLWEVGDV